MYAKQLSSKQRLQQAQQRLNSALFRVETAIENMPASKKSAHINTNSNETQGDAFKEELVDELNGYIKQLETLLKREG